MQTTNPNAPDYDWQADREWFNQRLSSERLRNANLHNRIVAMRLALQGIASPKAKAALAADTAARNAESVS